MKTGEAREWKRRGREMSEGSSRDELSARTNMREKEGENRMNK